MLYVKNNPIGIDIPIQKLQIRLFGQLTEKWRIAENMYNGYGRVYKNQADGGTIPEAYIGNGEYSESFLNDKVSVTSFFVVGDSIINKATALSAKVSVIFCVNLNQLYKNVTHRADEEVHFDAITLCDRFGFSVESVETGIGNVFKEFSYVDIQFVDMHPFHCFRINLSIFYNQC